MESIELDIWFKFIGYGNPMSKLWFVGIEEGGLQVDKPMVDQQEYEFKNQKLLYDQNVPSGNNRVWNVSKRVAENVQEETYFMSNIAPLPRRYETEKLNAILNVKNYRKRVIDERVKRLQALHLSKINRVTVFHGVGARRKYNLLEELNLSINAGHYFCNNILVFKNERYVFTNSFSRGHSFPDLQIEIVSDVIRSLLSSKI